MPALTRITHKIFGNTGATSSFGQFASAVTGTPVNTKDIASIMSLAAWSAEGWVTAVDGTSKVPALEEINSCFFVHSRQMAYLFQSGIPEYDASTAYYIGSVVRVGEYWYRALTDGETGNTPPVAASNAKWIWVNQPGVQPGVIQEWAGVDLPAGYLWRDGSAVSRTTYAALFAVLTRTTNGTLTSGSPVITSVGNTARLGAGMAVEGSNIPAGAKILTVDGASQITIDKNATASITTSLLIGPWGLGDGSTTFNLPGGTNSFDRVPDYTATQTGVATTRYLGSTQADSIKAHTHNTWQTVGGVGFTECIGGTRGEAGSNSGTSGSTGGTETRPINISIHSIIKY